MTAPTTRPAGAQPPSHHPAGFGWVRALCWLTVTLEGFDIVALSASLPTILETQHVGIDKADATFITTISLVGILVGALAVGPIADRFGRKRALIGSIALFSVLTLVVPWADSVSTFAALRFLAGIGLGACMPVALTAMSETVEPHQRARGTTLAMTGYHTGALLTALVGLVVMPDWEWLFIVGGVVGLAVIPVMWVKLPETSERAIARRAGEPEVEKVPFSLLLKQPYLVASLATWAASFMGLLLVYGLISWLPTIMSEAGYQLSTSLVMLFLLNLGGVAGLAARGLRGRRPRHPAERDRLVRRGRGLPRPAEHQDADPPAQRGRLPHRRVRLLAPRCSSTPGSHAATPPTCAAPRSASPRASAA